MFALLVSKFSMDKGIDSTKPSNLSGGKNILAKVICLPINPDSANYNSEKIVQRIKEFKR